MKKLYNVYVIKQMVNAIACTIELWMHLGGLLRTQEARVALGCRLVRFLRFDFSSLIFDSRNILAASLNSSQS